MRKSKHFLSLPVVTLEEGREVGYIRAVIVDPLEAEIAALVIQKSSPFSEQKIIPYTRVVSVGDSAVTIQKTTGVEKIAGIPHIAKLMKERYILRGARVITEGGVALGHVDEFFVNSETGKITSYEISGKFSEKLIKGKALLPAEEVRTIGKDVLIVKNGTEKNLAWTEGTLPRLAEKTRHFRLRQQKKDENDENKEN